MGVPRPCPSGYRLSPVRRWRVCGPASAAGVGRGSRSCGTGDSRIAPTMGWGSRGCDGGWWGCPAWRTSGYRLSPVRRWRVCGPARAAGGGGSFDRLRANGVGRRACGGGWGMRWGWRRPAPRPSGYRLSPVRRWGVCGSASAAGVGRGSRSGGTGDSRIAPTTWCGGVGDAMGVGDGGASPMPLWIPAFAGMTREGGPSTGSGRTDSRSAPMVGCCARGRGSCLRRNDGWGCGRRQGHADYKCGTKDGAALFSGPPRMNCLVGLGPFGGLWAFGCALFSSGSGPACRGHRVGRRGRTIAWVSAP